jgi:hypothetical protein
MITKAFATHTLTAILFISAPPWLFAQENPAPRDGVRPGVAPQPSATIWAGGRQTSETGPAAPEQFESLAVTPAAGSAKTKRVGNSRYVTSTREDIAPVVVQFSADNDNLDSLHEDLSIMGLMIRKAMETGPDDGALKKPEISFRLTSSSSVRTMYLEGFGAVVFVKVGFPLLGSAASPTPAPEAADSEWDRAKQDLFAENRKALRLDSGGGRPYDAGQVEKVKNQILGALKEATNLRSIKPADFVAVTIFGPPAATSGQVGAELRGTVLTIKVKKSDIDALAANKLDADKFKEKAAITAYPGTGYGLTSINSWAKGGGNQIRY